VRNVVYDGIDPSTAQARWSALAIGETLDELQAQNGGAITAYQATVLLRQLRDDIPSWGISRDDGTWRDRPSVHTIEREPQGVLSYRDSADRFMWLLPDGRTATLGAAPRGVDAATGAPIARPLVPTYRYWPGGHGAIALVAITALCDAVLWAYLFVGAAMMLRDEPIGAARHVRFLAMQLPLLVIGAFAMLWWKISLRAYPSLPPLASELSDALLVIITAPILYPLALLFTWNSHQARLFFGMPGWDPWHDARRCRAALAGLRCGVAWAIVIALLAIAHAAVSAQFWRAVPGGVGALLHMTCASVCAALSIGLFAVKHAHRRPPLLVCALLLVGSASPPLARAHAPATVQDPLTPWAAADLLADARADEPARAIEAITKLARAGEAGQEALLQLLDGPVPRVGLDRVLDTIGQEWFDTDAHWTESLRPRALRLLLEWTESIARADDPHRIAVLEAMGTDADIEPVLRPILKARAARVRKRAAAYLLRMDRAPAGMIRLLARDLAHADDEPDRAAICDALVNLRPTSDPRIGQILLDAAATYRPLLLEALLDAQAPPSPALLPAGMLLAEDEDPRLNWRAMRWIARDADGRSKLIDLALGASPVANTAQLILEHVWPASRFLFERLRAAQEPAQDSRVRAIARRVLEALNGKEDLAVLAEDPDADDELRSHALTALAGDAPNSRLGPVTFRWFESDKNGRIEPRAPVRWNRLPPAAVVGSGSPQAPASPPILLSILLCVTSAVVMFALPLLLWRQRATAKRAE
jgi:hypothetical protein